MLRDKQLNNSFFEKAIEFIQNYADKFHHAKEEDILFEELNKVSADLHCNPIEQMLYEHELGRKYIKNLKKAVAEKDTKSIIENTRNYTQLLQEHIFKEDNILYPMADSVLTEETQETILKRFKQTEQENIKEMEILK